jgi:lipopolysaccharide transport system permease protein
LLICIVTILLGGSIIGLLTYPFIFILLALSTLGITMLLAPLATTVSDITSIWSFVGTFLLLVTPIFYALDTASLVRAFNMVNPLFLYIELAREMLLYGTVQHPSILIFALCCSIIIPALGLSVFNARKKRIAELL